jgi:acetylglutamate kinase
VRVLIKVGGTLLANREDCTAVAQQLAAVARNHYLIVVHGGGKQVTQFLEERGVQSHFVNGLRISDENVVDAVTKVIAGGVNKTLVSALLGENVPAFGLSGVDGRLTSAEPLHPQLGSVGKPTNTDGRLLGLLRDAGYVPVVACIAANSRGDVLNVNADEMAVSCATAWEADRLIFLTDVPGVKNGTGQVMSNMTPPEIRELIRSGHASGGMRAKLEAAVAALDRGVSEVTIACGRENKVCERLMTHEILGTRLMLESTPAAGLKESLFRKIH